MTTSLDVLHIMWQGRIGGAERAVYQLALHQRRDGRRRVGIAYGQADGKWCEAAREQGVPVIDLGLRSGGDISGLVQSVHHFRSARILHFHGVEPLLMWGSGAVRNAGRVYTHRGGARSYSGARALRYRSVAPLIRRRFQVTGNTSHAAGAARRLFGLPPASEVPTTYNGLDISLLQPSRDRSELRKQHQVDDSTLVIGTAANLRAWKRIDWLIRAAASLPDRPWRMWILGDGPDRERLEDLAASSVVADRITFLGTRQRMGDWLRSMDIFALPSGPEESFGNAAVEAMACGLPVIVAADSPGMTEHVEHDVNGLHATSEADLGRQLSRLVVDSGERSRLGAGGEARVRQRYTMEAAVRAYEDVYRRVDPR